jgi:hypothetical protein
MSDKVEISTHARLIDPAAISLTSGQVLLKRELTGKTASGLILPNSQVLSKTNESYDEVIGIGPDVDGTWLGKCVLFLLGGSAFPFMHEERLYMVIHMNQIAALVDKSNIRN